MNGFSQLAAASLLGVLLMPTQPVRAQEHGVVEPKVQDVIEEARATVAESPDSAAAWGELGRVLHAHGILDEASTSYRRAMAIDPEDYRWPYLAASTDPPADVGLELLDRAHQLEPRDAALTLHYASQLTLSGQIDRARDLYLGLVDPRPEGTTTVVEGLSDPNRVGTESAKQHARLGLARIAMLEGRTRDALGLLEEAQVGPSRNADVYRLLALARQQTGDAAGAETAAWQARSYGPGLRPVSPVLDEMRARGRSVSALLDHGRRLSARGQHSAAQSLFERASHHDPSGEAQIDLGRIALAQSRNRDGVEHFEAALRVRPEDPDARVGLANAHLELDETKTAERELLKALSLRPDHAGAHRSLGRLRHRQGRYEEARQHLERALEADPTGYPAYADLAAALEGRGSSEGAIEARKKLDLLEPDDLDNLRSRARLEIRLKAYPAARRTLRRILDLQPGEFRATFNLAMLLATADSDDTAVKKEALELALRVYRTRPHDAGCVDLAGIAYAASGRFEEALQAGQRALELARGDGVMTRAIEEHLARYAEGRPVKEPRIR